MSLECFICRKEMQSGRHHVFICSHAGMPDGVVFTPDRRRYEWNCDTPSVQSRSFDSSSLNYGLFEEIKLFSKKGFCPSIFE